MSDYWICEATKTQGKLEDSNIELIKLQVLNDNFRRFLQAIVFELPEEDPVLVKKQRDRFIQIAKNALR